MLFERCWSSHLWYQVLKTGDDISALEFLVVAKTSGHDDHSDESDGQIKLQRHRQWSPLGRNEQDEQEVQSRDREFLTAL